VMAAFVDFSSVLFRQYFTWLVPFIPLAALDLLRLDPPKTLADTTNAEAP